MVCKFATIKHSKSFGKSCYIPLKHLIIINYLLDTANYNIGMVSYYMAIDL